MTPGAAVRLIVLLSAALALAFQLAITGWAHPLLLSLPVLSTVVALLAWHRWPGRTRGAAIVLAAFAPVAIRALWGSFDLTNGAVWLAPMLAIAAAEAGTADWSLPRRWALPLAFWGLCVAVGWPIVVMREADWAIALLTDTRTATTSQGVHVPMAVSWIAHVAAAQMIAVLWADSLCRVYSTGRDGFEREIMRPLAAALALSAGVGLYQIAVDGMFLNSTVFGVTNRAAGLFLDGNVFGVLMAVLIPVLFALTLDQRGRVRVLAAAGAAACLLCVWGSGSRTALLAATCCLSPLVVVWASARSVAARLAGVVGVAVLAVGFGVAVWAGQLSGLSARTQLLLERSWSTDMPVVEYLWNRDGFGTAAVRMIEEHPIVGVGVGTFHILVRDYSRLDNPSMGLSGDNAQNWLRHVVAEHGVLGSAGVVLFAILLVGSMLRRTPAGLLVRSLMVRSAIIGLGAASLMGVPTQHAFVLVVFLTLVVWHELLTREPVSRPPAVRQWGWGLAVALAVIFAVGTLQAARGDLRVSHRAIRFGWPYYVGYYGLEQPRPDLSFRWTEPHAKAAFAAERGYLKLTYWIRHADAEVNPVRVRFWRNGELVIDERLSDRRRRTAYLLVKGPLGGVAIESDVDRAWTPGRRLLGVAIGDWEVVATPPPDARVIN